MKTKRQINHEIYNLKWRNIYDEILAGASFDDIKKKYKYGSVNSARTTYYAKVVPYIKNKK